MTKLHLRIFISFTVALVALSVLSAGVSAGRTPQKAKRSKPATADSSKPSDTNAKLDLNTASEKDLDNLPGVGPASAKKIIAGRPYSSVDDLSKAGLSARTIKKIAPLVMVSGGAAAGASAKDSAPASQPSFATPSQPAPASPAKTAAPTASQGSWARNGVGEYLIGGLSPLGRSLVRKDKTGQVHDGRRCHEGRVPRIKRRR